MLLVSDANIFIDFEAGGLTELLFQLPHEIVVPDALYEQELSARHSQLQRLGLRIRSLNGEQVAQAYALQIKYRGPSVNDLLALVLAKSIPCPLVTGDGRLRAAAQAEGLELLGTLTLIEDLFARSLLSREGARRAYDAMRNAGRRLPWDDVDAQLRRIEHSR